MPDNGDDKKKKESYKVSFGAFQPGSSTDFRKSNEFDVDWTPDQIAQYEGDMQLIDKYKTVFNKALFKKNNLDYKTDSLFYKDLDTDVALARDNYLTPEEAAAAAKEAGMGIGEYYGSIKRMQNVVGGLNKEGLDFSLGFAGGKEGEQPLESQYIGQQHVGQAYTGSPVVPEDDVFNRTSDQVYTGNVYTGVGGYDPKTGLKRSAWNQAPTTTQATRIQTLEAAEKAATEGKLDQYQGIQTAPGQGVSTQQHAMPGDMVRGINPGTTTFQGELPARVAPSVKSVENPYKTVFANGGPLEGDPPFDPVRQQSNMAASTQNREQQLAAVEGRRGENAQGIKAVKMPGRVTSDPSFNPYRDFDRQRNDLLTGEMSDKSFQETSQSLMPTALTSSFNENRLQHSEAGVKTDETFSPYAEKNPFEGPTNFYRQPVQYMPDNSTMMVDPGRGRAAAGSFANGGIMPRQYEFGSSLAQGAGQALSALAPMAGMIPGVGTGIAAGAGALGAGLQNVGTGAGMGEVLGESLVGGAQGAMGAFGMKTPMGMPVPSTGMNFGHGGPMHSRYEYGSEMTNTTVYNGNTHENGGITLGKTGNEVEDGEVRWDAPGGEAYIFSNRLPYKK